MMTISIEKELKESFINLAKELWTNPTNLINMFMKSSINSRTISFNRQPISNLEIEPLDTQDWWEDFNKKSYELTTKMSDLLKTRKNEYNNN